MKYGSLLPLVDLRGKSSPERAEESSPYYAGGVSDKESVRPDGSDFPLRAALSRRHPKHCARRGLLDLADSW